MNVGTIAAVAAAAISSPLLLEMWKSWRDRNKRDVEISQAAIDLFYPTWKTEMERLHQEIAQLRGLVLALSDEVARLGGDPKRIMYAPPREKPNE